MDNKKIAIWGIGYIGFSNALYYSKAGYDVIGLDTDKGKFDDIKSGKVLKELEEWIPFDYKSLLYDDSISFTCNFEEIDYNNVVGHLICVPTEKDNEPWNDAIYDVLNKILKLHNACSKEQLTIIVESTLIPGTAKTLIEFIESQMERGTLYFGVAPRRDWFVAGGGNLNNLPRVFGCNSKDATAYIRCILQDVCYKLVEADDYQQAEMTKSVENSIRHVGITLANQLADAFPDIDIIRVLELAASKWNIQLYYPSWGIGGYCIPLSSKYLLQADKDDKLSILKETVTYNEERKNTLIELLRNEKIKTVGVLGVCYIGNIKVTKNSIILDVIDTLKNDGIEFKVDEPLLNSSEIEELTSCETFDINSRNKFDCLILFSGHTIYGDMSFNAITDLLCDKAVVWDNTGLWEKYAESFYQKGIGYKRIGKKGWQSI